MLVAHLAAIQFSIVSELSIAGVNLGDIGIIIFFYISGELITRSALNRNLYSYCISRAGRIFPALIVCNILTISVVSSLNADVSVSLREYLEYIFYNSLLLLGLFVDLQYVFSDHPFTAINGSLWTLPVELRLYIVFSIICLMKKYSRFAEVFVIFLLIVTLTKLVRSELMSLRDPEAILYFAFCVGSLSNFYKPSLLVLCLIVLSPFINLDFSLTLKLITLFAITQFTKIKIYRPLALDISYGLYLYHFPIFQIMRSLDLHINAQIILGVIITVSLSILSAQLIEGKVSQWKTRSL